MQAAMSNGMFRLMSLEFKLKALFSSPAALLEEAGVREGMTILDYGCGPGRYAIPAARLVGSTGKVYAVDLHPFALAGVERAARRRGLENVETVATDSALPLPDASVDLVLLYDTLHDIAEREAVVREIVRVLRAGGTLSYRDHTLAVESAFGEMIGTGRLGPPAAAGRTARLVRSTPAC